MLLFVPAFFLLLYGYALNFDVQNVALAVIMAGVIIGVSLIISAAISGS